MIMIITNIIIALIIKIGMTVPNTTGSEFELEETMKASVVEIFAEITIIIKITCHQ